jgi:hypothetical protein
MAEKTLDSDLGIYNLVFKGVADLLNPVQRYVNYCFNTSYDPVGAVSKYLDESLNDVQEMRNEYSDRVKKRMRGEPEETKEETKGPEESKSLILRNLTDYPLTA